MIYIFVTLSFLIGAAIGYRVGRKKTMNFFFEFMTWMNFQNNQIEKLFKKYREHLLKQKK